MPLKTRKNFVIAPRFIRKAERLQLICRKVLQVYRIKTKCMYKREAVLKKIAHDHNALNDPVVHSILHTCLEREKKLLAISLRSYRKDLSLAEFAEAELSSAAGKSEKYHTEYMQIKSNYEGSNMFESYFVAFKQLNSELHLFFCDFEAFIKMMIHGIGDVETRIVAEEKALESKDPGHFQEFLNLWEQEVNDNKELEVAYERIFATLKKQALLYKACEKTMQRDKGQDSVMYATPGLPAGLALIASMILFVIMPGEHGAASYNDPGNFYSVLKAMGMGVIGIAVCAYILYLFLRDMEPYMKYEFKLDSYDHEMIEKIKHQPASSYLRSSSSSL